MIKANYPEWFEDFWKQALALRTRSLGSKAAAHKVAKQLRMGAEDVDMVIDCFKRFTDKTKASRRGEIPFFADHKDLSGWLNQRHWDSEEDEQIEQYKQISTTRQLTKSERRDEAARKYLEENNDDGMAGFAGYEVSSR